MKRSKSVSIGLLLSSIALVIGGCSDTVGDDTAVLNAQTDGMAFDSYEDCSINIGAENCRKEPVKNPSTTQASSGGGGSSFLFLPMPGFGGGYNHDAPRNQPGSAYAGKGAWNRSAPALGAPPRMSGVTAPSFGGKTFSSAPAATSSSSVAGSRSGSTSTSSARGGMGGSVSSSSS